MFNDENAHRRRASLATSEDHHTPVEPKASQPQHSSCFVHQLLEKQRSSGNIKPTALISPALDKKLDKGTNDEGKEIHSRLLTKRQLADMAMGVRELSKKLGSVRLKLKVKTVFLLVKAHDESLIQHSKDMVDWLLSNERDTPYTVCAV